MAASSDENRPNTEPPAEPRRRAEDRSAPSTEPGKLTAREIFQKMRRPMIGLGMIGAAVPMVNATSGDSGAKPQEAASAQTNRVEPSMISSAASALDLLRLKPKRFRWYGTR